MLGLYWDHGKENGNHYLGFRALGLRELGQLSGKSSLRDTKDSNGSMFRI